MKIRERKTSLIQSVENSTGGVENNANKAVEDNPAR